MQTERVTFLTTPDHKAALDAFARAKGMSVGHVVRGPRAHMLTCPRARNPHPPNPHPARRRNGRGAFAVLRAQPAAPVPTPPPVYRFDRLLLIFGLAIAACTFAYWTMLEYERFGRWMGEGLLRAVVVLGAMGVLAVVFWLAQWLEDHREL